MIFKRSLLARFARNCPQEILLLPFLVGTGFAVYAAAICGDFLHEKLAFSFVNSLILSALGFLGLLVGVGFAGINIIKLADKTQAPERAIKSQLHKIAHMQLATLFPLLNANRPLFAALEQKTGGDGFLSESGWLLDVEKKYEGLYLTATPPGATQKVVGFLLCKRSTDIEATFDTDAHLTEDLGHEVLCRPERFDVWFSHIEGALVEFLRTDARGPWTEPAPALALPTGVPARADSMPVLSAALAQLSRDAQALHDTTMAPDARHILNQLLDNAARLRALVAHRPVSGPDAELVQDFLLGRLASALKNWGAVAGTPDQVAPLLEPLDALVRHFAHAVGALQAQHTQQARAEVAHAVAVVDILHPRAAAQAVPQPA